MFQVKMIPTVTVPHTLFRWAALQVEGSMSAALSTGVSALRCALTSATEPVFELAPACMICVDSTLGFLERLVTAALATLRAPALPGPRLGSRPAATM